MPFDPNAAQAAKTDTIPAGLTAAQVAERVAQGRVNRIKRKDGRGYLSIVAENLFTFFNLVWAIVSVILIRFGLFTHLTYLAVIVPNILIATFQAIRAKKMVEKLSVSTQLKARVMRDGALVQIAAEEIVADDVIFLEMGNQVLSDAVVLCGIAEANESMLTGESDAIRKQEGDRLLSGSYLVGGAVYARVTAVGRENYMNKIESAAKRFKAPASNLFRDLDKLIKYIGIMMIPMSALLFFTNYRAYDNLTAAVEKTSGSIIGMIPAGIYLLVTLTLSLSVVSLGKKKTLVQDMYSIEMLASTDTICLDKTGTITDGTMRVTAVEPLGDLPVGQIERLMARIEGAEQSINHTARALIARFGADPSDESEEKIPFSSERKYSAVRFGSGECFAIGAPHFVPCPIGEALEAAIGAHTAQGERVLLLAGLPDLQSEGEALALIALCDNIRPNAAETIAHFQDQGVTVRILSGDHAETVATIAGRVGVKNADRFLSCEDMSDEQLASVADHYAVFGRVTPEQKILLVRTLRSAGHTVAMTGDGVNDTLALKESDCAIAMGDGSEMAQKVSEIVLLDSDFARLPDVVREGRRCINNVRMSAVLFLMKTIYTILLSLFSVIASAGYPFGPNQFLPIEMIVIGMASLLLALEPNNKRIEGSFIRTVLKRSAPNALLMFLPTAAVVLLGKAGVFSPAATSAVAAFSVTLVGFINLVFLCIPYTRWRGGVILLSTAAIGIVYTITIFLMRDIMLLLPAFSDAPAAFALTLLASALLAVATHLVLLFAARAKR